MFTGIITAMGTVRAVDRTRGDLRFLIETPWDAAVLPTGASVACSGCCLTVVGREGNAFAVDVSGETLSKTTLAEWGEGSQVNLERPLKLGDELGGHIVSGHVDGVAVIESVRGDGDSHRLKIRAPQSLKQYLVPKGSVALDGVSLTVNEVDDNVFGVNIIPHTWAVTSLGRKRAGESVNMEIDLLARYVARMMGR